MKRAIIAGAILSLSALVLAIASVAPVRAKTTSSFIVEYLVPGSPQNVVVESPGRIWFTMPGQNMIGRLTVTSTVEYEVVTYALPTANSEPYDLDYAAGKVWFTEQAGNRIGRLDPATGTIDEFPIPTTDSAPAGIAAAPDGRVWFAERNGNKLACLTIASLVVDEFAFPMSSGQLQDIVVENSDSIWFTAPGVDRLFNFRPSKWPLTSAFYGIWAGSGAQPSGVAMGGGFAWIAAYGTNRVGRYTPQTIADWRWYSLSAGSGPTGIASDTYSGLNRIWFAEADSGRVGRLDTTPNGTPVGLWEWPLPSANSQPQGIAVDSNGHAWIAEKASNRIAEWQPPYAHYIYLTTVMR